MKKAQTEIIVIIGILAVAVVVAFYTILGGGIVTTPVPEGILAEQRLVADSINNIIRDSADSTLRTMMTHGGYLDDRSIAGKTYMDVAHTSFLLKGVPYWQRCDNTMVPDIREVQYWMERSIEEKVREGVKELEGVETYGNIAEFDKSKIDVDAKIMGVSADMREPDIIDITVRMPTTVREYAMSSNIYPYNVKVKTKFGRIYAFGRDFALASAENRYFDIFTIVAIYFSQRAEGTHTRLPTFGVLTDCGEVLYRSPHQINTALLEVVEYVLATTFWWTPMQDQSRPPGSSMPKWFAIDNLNGRQYSDLNVLTLFTDGFVFNILDYIFVTNFDMPRKGPYVIPVCTEVYNHGYNFNYPFIVRVKDPYTGYSLNFASEVSVRDKGNGVMQPGDCGAPGPGSDICQGLECKGKVRVVNDQDEPLQGAFVVFGGCPLGDTDEDGYVEGPIECGTKELYVYQSSEYEFFRKSVSSAELSKGYVVTLNDIHPVTVHFRQVKITHSGVYTYMGPEEEPIEQAYTCDACSKQFCPITDMTEYRCVISTIDRFYAFVEFDDGQLRVPVTNADIGSMPPECRNSEDCRLCESVTEELSETESLEELERIRQACSRCITGCMNLSGMVDSVEVDYLPSGHTYTVDAEMHNPFNEFIVNGGFSYSGFTFGRDDKDIYVYIPRRSSDRNTYEDHTMGNAEKSCLVAAMEKCGIEPVSTTKYHDITTTIILTERGCTCENLEILAGACQVSVSGLSCTCPEGGSYDMDCLKPCGVTELNPPCGKCCDKVEMLKRINNGCRWMKVVCEGVEV